MSSIKKMLIVLAGLLVFTYFPAFAQEAAKSTVSEKMVPTVSKVTPTALAEDQKEGKTTLENHKPTTLPELSETMSLPEVKSSTETTATPQQEVSPTPTTGVTNTTENAEDKKAETEAQEPHVEVFVDSNALNSKIIIQVGDKIVSGPGKKVLADVPVGSTFKLITKAAEGSTAMGISLKARTKDGQIEAMTPESQEGNTQTFRLAENVEDVFGAIFFGNSTENSMEEAQKFINDATSESEVEPKTEIFVDSNALNSKITIQVDDEIVSGPGNKVLAVVPVGSTFKMIIEAAEGSTAMNIALKARNKNGQIEAMTPESQKGNTQTFHLAKDVENVFGAVFFGNSTENSMEEAQQFINDSTSESAAQITIVNSEVKVSEQVKNTQPDATAKVPQTEKERSAVVESNNDTGKAAPIVADNAPNGSGTASVANASDQPSQAVVVTEASSSPETGIEEHFDLVPVFLTAILVAGVTLWSRKKVMH